ncbi:MAG: response regulator [Desulfosarcinaceae bacterium]|jgi:CheY-like chemotaxis protein
MKHVLIIDDEQSFLLTLSTGLESYAERFQVLTARDGEAAITVLEEHSVDLVVTDLRMPNMDGFELMAYMASNYPAIPVVVLTAHATPETEKQLALPNTIRILEKPVDFDELTRTILENLRGSDKGGSVTGISLPSFMDLIEKEEKSCMLEVHKNNRRMGVLLFNQGDLWDAVSLEQKGIEAVFELLALDEVRIRYRNLPKKKIKRRIKVNLISLLMESARRQDEKAENDALSAEPDVIAGATRAETSAAPIGSLTEAAHTDAASAEAPLIAPSQKGVNNMAEMTEVLEKFKNVEGFQAAGAFSPQGEMVTAVNPAGIKLDELGALANDVLLKAQKATEIMNVGRGQVVHVEAPKAHVLARCLNEATDFAATTAGRAHVHMVVILEKDANVAMAKMKLDGIIQEIADFFR